jgi:hypothetical protein
MKNNTMTIAEQLNIKEFPFKIKDKQGNLLYFENSSRCWFRYEYDSDGNEIYSENSKNNIITLNGIKYKRIDERD